MASFSTWMFFGFAGFVLGGVTRLVLRVRETGAFLAWLAAFIVATTVSMFPIFF